MQTSEVQQIILDYIKHAQAAKHSEFRFIRNWLQFKFYRRKRKSFKILLGGLNKSANRLFKAYCQEVTRGEANFNKLLAYQQVQLAIDFYTQELNIINEIIDEYDNYLAAGNFASSFLGAYRSEEDLVDFRNKE